MGNARLSATGGGSTQQEACPQLPDAGPPDQMEQQEPASGGVHDTKWTAEEKEWKQKVAAVRRVAPRERKRALEKARRRACTTIEVRQNSWIWQRRMRWMRCRGAVRVLQKLQDVQGRHRGEMVQRAASLVRRPTMKRWPLAARHDKRRDRCEVPCEALASGSKT